jgi:hypothetical protein
MKTIPALVTTLAFSIPAMAFAQEGATADDDAAQTPESVPNDGDLPPPQSTDEPRPEVATPGVPAGGIVQQAGVGSPTGYGRAGVLELGGAASFTAASDFTQVLVTPSIGWFIADNFQLSALFDIGYVSTEDASSSIASLLLEPSYHMPFNRAVFGFLGLGLGASRVEEYGTGFAMAPRIGANVMVGRSGVLTPSLSWQYTTHDFDTTDGDDNENNAVVAVSSALRFNVGYTVMW